MFLQGAEGNVDPVCRGALDMADPDQAVGSSFQVLGETSRRMSECGARGPAHSPGPAEITRASVRAV